MALTTLVARPDWDVETDSTASPQSLGPVPPPQGPLPPITLPPPQVGHNRVQYFREKLARDGFDEGVLELILQGYKHSDDKKGTLRSHQKIWEGYINFCDRDFERALRFEVRDVANFISKLFKDGKQGSVVDTTVTVLDSTRALASPETPALAQNEIIKKLRSSAKKRRPSRKRAEEPDTYFDPFYSSSSLRCERDETRHEPSKKQTRIASPLRWRSKAQ